MTNDLVVRDESLVKLMAGFYNDQKIVVLKVTENGALEIDWDGEISAPSYRYEKIFTGQDIIATPGTAQQLNGGVALEVPPGSGILIMNDPQHNTGFIRIATSKSEAETGGIPLDVGSSYFSRLKDVSYVWVDADVGGDIVRWSFEGDL